MPIKYLWDQACVLKQLQVISNKVQWPVTGKEQADVLSSPKTVQLISLNDQIVDIDHQKVDQLLIFFFIYNQA